MFQSFRLRTGFKLQGNIILIIPSLLKKKNACPPDVLPYTPSLSAPPLYCPAPTRFSCRTSFKRILYTIQPHRSTLASYSTVQICQSLTDTSSQWVIGVLLVCDYTFHTYWCTTDALQWLINTRWLRLLCHLVLRLPILAVHSVPHCLYLSGAPYITRLLILHPSPLQ